MDVGAVDIVSGGGDKKGKKSSSKNGGNGSCCNCRNSQCSQLYCYCFCAGKFCNESCTCKECMNTENNKDKVHEKRKEIELRDPQAFQPKIIFGENGAAAKHKKGCNCKRSQCKNNYCVCFSAGVGCHSQCKCERCMNEYGLAKDQQEQHVLTNNNNGGNNVMVDNPSSSQSHHPLANNDYFTQVSKSDVDMILGEREQEDYCSLQMLLAGDGENGIHNNNVILPSNQVNHVPASASYYDYNVYRNIIQNNVYGNIIQNNVSAPNYHHQTLAPTQISGIGYNNTIGQQNTSYYDIGLLGESSFPRPSWSYYDNNVGGEHSSVHSFSTMEPLIQSSSQQYEPQTQSYDDLFQQEATSSVSGAMNQNAQLWQNDATNMQPHSHPNNNHLR